MRWNFTRTTPGLSEVQTLLNSGNAVFSHTGRSAAAHAKAIGAGLKEGRGLNVNVVVKSASAFSAAVSENPLEPREEDGSRFLAAFAQERAALQEVSALLPLVRPPERFSVGRQAAYLHCAGGMLESKVANALLGKIGHAVTPRNWATVLKLEALMRSGAA